MISTKVQDTGFFATWTRLIRRRWMYGCSVFVVVLGTGAAILFLSRPIYRAEARLRLDDPPPTGGVTPTTGGFFGLPRLSADPFTNDLELLTSRTITERMISDVTLNVIVEAPRGWHRDSLFMELAASRNTSKARYSVEWLKSGRVRVRMTSPEKRAVAEVAPGASLSFDGATMTFRAWREGAPRKIGVRTLPFGEAVRVMRDRIHTERTRREANVLDIWFDHSDPAVAKRAVTSVVQRFVEFRTAIQRRESGQTVDSLRVVANETNIELRNAESAMQDIAKTSRLVAPDTQSKSIVGRYNETVGQLEKSRAELDAVNAVLTRVAHVTHPTDAWTTLVAHPRFLENVTVGEMLSRLSQLEQKRQELALRRTEGSREYQLVTDQITYLDGSLRSLAESYRAELREQVSSLQARVTTMDSAILRVPTQMIEIGRRQRAARILSDFMALTEMRLRQEKLRQALTFSNVQVIDPPELRYKAIWPRKGIGLAVALLLAAMSATIAMLAVDKADLSQRRAQTTMAVIARERELANSLE